MAARGRSPSTPSPQPRTPRIEYPHPPLSPRALKYGNGGPEPNSGEPLSVDMAVLPDEQRHPLSVSL